MKDDENRNRHILHYVDKRYDWLAIVLFFATGGLLIYLYLINGTGLRALIFGLVLGAWCALAFKPWQKRIHYVPYAEMSDGEEIPYTPVKKPFAGTKFEKLWATAEDIPHYEFPPAANFRSPMTGKAYNEKGEPQEDEPTS